MSFVSNALGIGNGYNAASAAGPRGQITFDPDLVKNAQAANANYGTINTSQTALANALNALSQGQGPNLANLQLQQATNQNNQQAAGAAASQRGMNPALAQRIIMQQQAMNNQNAAGQSGILRAQQQLAAQQALAGVLGQQAGEANSNLAANYSALGNQNNAVTGAVNSANQTNAQIAQNNANQNAGIAGGIISGVGSIFSGLAEGGEVEKPEKHLERLLISIGNKVEPKKLAGGGFLGSFGSSLGSAPMNAIDPGLAQGPSAQANNLFGGISGQLSNLLKNPMSGASDISGGGFAGADMGGSGAGTAMLAAAKGGKVPALLSPGELYVPPHKVPEVSSGKSKASEVGKRVPGKAKVKGDSLKNDVYPADLEAGGVVVPRSKADNDKDAREFLLAIKADKEKKGGPSGYAKILAVKRKNAS